MPDSAYRSSHENCRNQNLKKGKGLI